MASQKYVMLQRKKPSWCRLHLSEFYLIYISRAIDEALEQVGILLALRQAPEIVHQGMVMYYNI